MDSPTDVQKKKKVLIIEDEGDMCLLLNIILFTIYINSRKDQTAKGVFAVTLVYAILSLIVKLTG